MQEPCQGSPGDRLKKGLKGKGAVTKRKGWRGTNNGPASRTLIIPDPWIERGKKHVLMDILLLCIIAVARGVESIENIPFFAETRLGWLKNYHPAQRYPQRRYPSAGSGPDDSKKFEESFFL